MVYRKPRTITTRPTRIIQDELLTAEIAMDESVSRVLLDDKKTSCETYPAKTSTEPKAIATDPGPPIIASASNTSNVKMTSPLG